MNTPHNGTLVPPHRFSVAPMMDWTDRHCRYFHRLLTRHALLYTEMVTTGALIHGDVARHLDFSEQEHPIALQVGGSEPKDLSIAAKLAQDWGYQEINLNCGCPSERVQRGSFGACLMAEPTLVADCVAAMSASCSLPVTVKHRIGLDKNESFEFLTDFVGTVAQAGCQTFIVHARNAWLKGLSPKENREVPPLRYDWVHRLKREFPHLTIVVNGGLEQWGQILELLEPQSESNKICQLDGVMVGRKAYHDPYWLTQVDRRLFLSRSAQHPITENSGEVSKDPIHEVGLAQRLAIVEQMIPYIETQGQRGVPAKSITRHMIGLFNGLPRARNWRQHLSDPKKMSTSPIETIKDAMSILERTSDFDVFNQGAFTE